MAVEKIANRQLFIILLMLRSSIVIAFLPVLTTADALQDAWLAGIVSFFGAALLVVLIGALAVRYPQETLVQYSQKLLGKWPGKIISLIPLGAFLFMAATDVRIYADALVTAFLTATPVVFIIGSMVLANAFAARAGIEVIGRAADLFFPLFILAILTSLVLAAPQAWQNLSNLEPVLARGAGPMLRGALTPVALTSQFLVLAILVPAAVEPKRVLRSALGALGLSTVILALISIATIAVLGPQKGARSTFPFLTLVRALQVSEFIERIEVLAMFAWGFAHFIGLAVFLYCGAKGLSEVLGLKSYRVLVWPMAVVWVTLGAHGYRDNFQLQSLFQPGVVFPLTVVGFILLPIGLLWLAHGIRAFAGRLKDGAP